MVGMHSRCLTAVPLLDRVTLRAQGLTETEIRRRLSPAGDLVCVARGVYVDRSVWESAPDLDRHRLQARAALRVVDTAAVVSHGSAAVVRDLATLRASRSSVHLTRPGLPRTKQRSGYVLHGGRLDADEVDTVAGLPVTTLGRTVADLARADGLVAGLVVADQTMRLELTRDELAKALDRQHGLPGTACFGRLLAQADPGADNPGETLARILVTEVTAALGMGAPSTQFRVSDDERTAYADLAVGHVLIEFDGRWKYARERPFGDGSTPEEVVWAEKTREDWLRSLGYVVVRLIWDDVWGAGRHRAAARLRAVLMREIRT